MSDKSLSDWIEPKYKTKKSSNVIPVSKKHSGTEEDITEITVEQIGYEEEDFESDLSFGQEIKAHQRNSNGRLIDREIPFESELPSPGVATKISREQYIRPNLEKIIFDEKELKKLKGSVVDLMLEKIAPKNFKELVLSSYARIFEESIEYISFFLAQRQKNLFNEIEEKDKLLEQLGQRINQIYLALKDKELDVDDDIQTERPDIPSSLNDLNDESIYIDGECYQLEECFFVIDGANIALANKNNDDEGRLANLYLLIEKLRSLGIKNYKILCDPSLNYRIDNKEKYSELNKNKIFYETPAGTEADLFILQYAKLNNAFIITNDMFRKHYVRFGEEWIRKRRITFSFIDDVLFFDRLYTDL